MGQHVNGIRDAFYRDITQDYRTAGRESFLYGYFRGESLREFLEKSFPGMALEEYLLLEQNEPQLREQMLAWGKAHPAQLKSMLLKPPPGGAKKERRDFWQELLLNDTGYRAGLIGDTEYYLWLAEYLEARSIYYKDSSPWEESGFTWLFPMLDAGLGPVKQGDSRTRAQVERDVSKLAEQLRREREAGSQETAGRLHHLTCPQTAAGDGRGREMQGDYLPWLTARLEQMAMHIKIKTWLQDSGYPFKLQGGEAQPSGKEPRKQDFTMRLFENFCDSPHGYDFAPKAFSGWHLRGREFCVLDTDAEAVETLVDALERRYRQEDLDCFYLPLAVHLYSGCVFFLAGKGVYENLYQNAPEEVQEAYKNTKAHFCFDFLQLDTRFWEWGTKPAAGPFRLKPLFHKRAGLSYQEVLDRFKRYCISGEESVLRTMQQFNMDAPADTPEDFHWAFDALQETESQIPSQESREAFFRSQNGTRGNPMGPLG